MVDENGEPMVFYHNTDADFTVFDSDKNGTHTDAGWLGDGFYFYGEASEGGGYGKNKMAAYLNIREPYYASSEENSRLAEADDRAESIAFREELEADGYDGVYYDGDLRKEAVVFNANQIKSATENVGSFSGESDDVRFSIRSTLWRVARGEAEAPAVARHRVRDAVAADAVAADAVLLDEYARFKNAQQSGMKVVERAFVDDAKPIEDFQEWMQGHGATLSASCDAYSDVFLAKGRVSYAMQRSNDAHFSQLFCNFVA